MFLSVRPWRRALAWLAGCRQPEPQGLQGATAVARPPVIHPDYAGCVVPPNLAPLNFCIQEPGERYVVEIKSQRGTPIRIAMRGPEVRIPQAAWHSLLQQNPGEQYPRLRAIGFHLDQLLRHDTGHFGDILRIAGIFHGIEASCPADLRAGADGVIVASALVDALGPDGRDVPALARLVGELRVATARS